MELALKLQYLGEFIDHTAEHEIFSDTEYGFTVEVMTKTGPVVGHQYTVFNNVTEVHYLHNITLEHSVAIESNIHQTGVNLKLDDVVQLTITESSKIYESF